MEDKVQRINFRLQGAYDGKSPALINVVKSERQMMFTLKQCPPEKSSIGFCLLTSLSRLVPAAVVGRSSGL